jgi:pimeloyl-ACP methyl ester carboxylesterase
MTHEGAVMAIHPGRFRRTRHTVIAAVLLGLLSVVGLAGCSSGGAAAAPAPAPSAAPAAPPQGPKPTVVLVHGAFADASSWNGVVTRLQKQGYTVVAPALAMRSLAADSAYLAGLLAQIPGPVVLAGHSYGGAVISNAATGAKNVRALVYVNGFATEQGEVLAEAEKGSTDSALNPALEQYTYPTGVGSATAVELLVDPAKFPAVFAGDLPPEEQALLAATQRPAAAAVFSEPSGAPAWKTIPSWAVVSTGDKAAGTDVTLSMAKRAKATITELPGSHLIMVSQPDAVTDVILKAAAAQA